MSQCGGVVQKESNMMLESYLHHPHHTYLRDIPKSSSWRQEEPTHRNGGLSQCGKQASLTNSKANMIGKANNLHSCRAYNNNLYHNAMSLLKGEEVCSIHRRGHVSAPHLVNS